MPQQSCGLVSFESPPKVGVNVRGSSVIVNSFPKEQDETTEQSQTTDKRDPFIKTHRSLLLSIPSNQDQMGPRIRS